MRQPLGRGDGVVDLLFDADAVDGRLGQGDAQVASARGVKQRGPSDVGAAEAAGAADVGAAR